MSERKEKKFHWRVLILAVIVLPVSGILILFLSSLFRDFIARHYILRPLYYPIYKLKHYLLFDPSLGQTYPMFLLISFLIVIFLSLLIERAYYLFRKWKMKKQAGGSGE